MAQGVNARGHVARHKTAITRTRHSKPIQRALEDLVVEPNLSVFDYGCGKGADVHLLREAGYECGGWDPAYAPEEALREADVVNLGYVLNVIEDSEERVATLRKAFGLAKRRLIVAAQLAIESNISAGAALNDGVLTRWGTFQKYYEQDELASLIRITLGVEPVAATLGVFYVFRDESDRQGFLARQVLRVASQARTRALQLEEMFAPHRDLLEAFARQVELLGRVPRSKEFEQLDQVREIAGGPKRLLRLCARLIPGFSPEQARQQRSQDLLVYIALAKFQGRPPFKDLPEVLQWDIRDLFGSYTKACAISDELLFRVGRPGALDETCKESSLGKLLPDDLYVHASLVHKLNPVLRVYFGCARALVGDIPDANIVKFHRRSGKLSYLTYPTFDSDAHPALAKTVSVNLRSCEMWSRDYTKSENPPILHRKEALVDPSYPQHDIFSKLSAAEESAGLLGGQIGFAKAWEQLLASKGMMVTGHELVPKGISPSHE